MTTEPTPQPVEPAKPLPTRFRTNDIAELLLVMGEAAARPFFLAKMLHDLTMQKHATFTVLVDGETDSTALREIVPAVIKSCNEALAALMALDALLYKTSKYYPDPEHIPVVSIKRTPQ